MSYNRDKTKFSRWIYERVKLNKEVSMDEIELQNTLNYGFGDKVIDKIINSLIKSKIITIDKDILRWKE